MKKTESAEPYTLPILDLDGWTLEPWGVSTTDVHVLQSPSGYMVSIDFRKRAFVPGHTPLVRPDTGRRNVRYVGRGWADQLLAAAVEHLRKVEGLRANCRAP